MLILLHEEVLMHGHRQSTRQIQDVLRDLQTRLLRSFVFGSNQCPVLLQY